MFHFISQVSWNNKKKSTAIIIISDITSFISSNIKSRILICCSWVALTFLFYLYSVGLKEMNSGVRFPNHHNRQQQEPGVSSPPSSLPAASIHLSALSNCQTSKTATTLCFWHSSFYSSSGWLKFAYVTNLVSPEMRQVIYKSHLQELPCFLLLALCTLDAFMLTLNSEVGHFSRYTSTCAKNLLSIASVRYVSTTTSH